MDENNEHGNVMTKPLPYGCIKKQEKSPPLKNLILSLTTFSTKIKLDIYFLLTLSFIKSNEKMLLFNEIWTPLFGKNKLIKQYERPVLQLLIVISRDEEKDITNNLKHNEKTHSTMKGKNLSLYMQNTYIFW